MSGCSGGGDPPAPPAEEVPPPRLATEPPAQGEVVLRGRVAPRTHPPVPLQGRYLVRFAQWAPEDRSRDFARETSFVASLLATGGRTQPLFKASAARGERRVRLDGRYALDVSFGDFPYVVRFTPLG
jgi:hypothetical protein